MKRIIAGLMSICMVVTITACTTEETMSNEMGDTSITIDVYDYDVVDELVATDESLSYEGDLIVTDYADYPEEGNEFVIVDVGVTKESDGNSVDLGDMTLSGYERYDSSILSNYGYTPLSTNEITFGEYRGDAIFEVPVGTTDMQIELNGVSKNIDDITVVSNDVDYITDTNIGEYHNIIDEQRIIEQGIIQEFENGDYTLDNPLIVVDPYGIAPLSALVMFQTDDETDATIKIHGKDEYTDVEYIFDDMETIHQLPIYALYENTNNVVTITVNDGKEEISKDINIMTDELPDIAPEIDLIESKPAEMSEGLTFLTSNGKGYTAVDSNGDIRWYIVNTTNQIFRKLDNGNFIILDNIDEKYGSSRVLEINMLGRVANTYFIGPEEHNNDPINIHHDFTQDANGDFWATLSDGSDYYEDFIRVMDDETGEVINEISYRDIFDERFYDNPNNGSFNSMGSNDWMHMNAIWTEDDGVIVSSRHQDMVVKTDYDNNIKWILAEHNDFPADYEQYLLTPIDENNEPIITSPASVEGIDAFKFPSSQHSTEEVYGLDDDPNTTDVILYDNNGAVRRGNVEESRKYSRAVIYRINEVDMTVQELWSFGEELGAEYFTDTQGDADYLYDTDNVLVTYSVPYAKARENGDLISAVFEVDVDTNDILYEIEVGQENMSTPVYRAERLPAYDENSAIDIYTNTAKQYNEPDITEGISVFDAQLPEVNSSFEIESIGLSSDKELVVKGEGDSNLSDTKVILIGDTSYESYFMNTYGRTYNSHVDISELPPGHYEVGLTAYDSANDLYYYTDTEYYFDIKDESNTSLENQKAIDNKILSEYESGNYTAADPFVVVDPYNLSPLTALVMFDTEEPTPVYMTVKGKDSEEDITHTFEANTTHYLPVYGLYADTANKVEITVDGIRTTTIIQTDPLPSDMYDVSIEAMDKEEVADGLIFVEGNNLVAIDNAGDVRWYFSNELYGVGWATPIRRLENGNIAIHTEDVVGQYYASGLYEMNYLGKIYNFYDVPHAHHDIVEMPNGNFLVPSVNDEGRHTEEDYVVEVDRTTGEIVNRIDLYDILDIDKIADQTYVELQNAVTLYDENATDEENQAAVTEYSEEDWLHMNAINYIPEDNSLIISARNQDMVIKLDYATNEVKWILSDPNDDFGLLTDKLLTPVGDNFEYQYGQHAAFMDDDMLYLYDNGNYRSKDVDDVIDVEDNYSNGVAYKINEDDMTVEEVWEYGKNVDFQTFTPYIGDIDLIDTDHYLINFGGLIIDDNGNPSDSISAGFAGIEDTETRIIEVKDDEVIANILIQGDGYANNYRASRADMYEGQNELTFE